MAKRKMTVDQIEIKILERQEELDQRHQQYKKLGDEMRDLREEINQLVEQRAQLVGVTIQEALEAWGPGGENVLGYRWLQERSFKGEWKGTGLSNSGVWHSTGQHGLQIRLEREDDDAKLDRLETAIQQVIPHIKAGMGEAVQLRLLSKGSSVGVDTLKIIQIADDGCCQYNNWQLALMPSGEWVIYDAYGLSYSFTRARFTGTLRECLDEVRFAAAIRREEEEEY